MTQPFESPFGHSQNSAEQLPAKPKVNFTAHAAIVLGLYVLTWIVAAVVGAITGAFEEERNFRSSSDIHPGQLAVGILYLGGMLLTLVAFGILIHRMWSLINPAITTLTPGAATALSVIPLVNIVGVFFTFAGLVPLINREAAARGLGEVRLSYGLALSACICKLVGVLGCIPIIGCVFALAALTGTILWYVSLFQMASACDKLTLRPTSG